MKRLLQNSLTGSLLSMALLASTANLGWADMTPEEVRNGYKVNAALAQFHRWFQ